MTERKRPSHPSRRRPGIAPPEASPVDHAAAPFLRERRAIEAILRVEALSRAADAASAERSALDVLARLVEAFESREGLDCALAEARAILRARRG
jgi:hypothetical protein